MLTIIIRRQRERMRSGDTGRVDTGDSHGWVNSKTWSRKNTFSTQIKYEKMSSLPGPCIMPGDHKVSQLENASQCQSNQDDQSAGVCKSLDKCSASSAKIENVIPCKD